MSIDLFKELPRSIPNGVKRAPVITGVSFAQAGGVNPFGFSDIYQILVGEGTSFNLGFQSLLSEDNLGRKREWVLPESLYQIDIYPT